MDIEQAIEQKNQEGTLNVGQNSVATVFLQLVSAKGLKSSTVANAAKQMDQENSGTDQNYEIQASKVDQSIRAFVRKSLKFLVLNMDVVKPSNCPHLVTNVDRVECQDFN